MLFQNILVAYDGSKAANKALDKAVALSKLSPGTQLQVLHAYDYPRLYVAEGFAPVPASINKEVYELAEQIVLEAEQRLEAAGAAPNVSMVQGSPAETILDYAKERGVDLIVIGSRGLGGIRQFVLGSVSHNVVQHAEVPVLIVK
ncbi:universal stress protein [Paenibacillus sanguinis]|uniref:universal stress protein n=1 Tax=Paenibacillus sanguinis TaxID=225906 RepID=UPI0003610768|nr:universal stress protein [Paenibacillus sanguinis]